MPSDRPVAVPPADPLIPLKNGPTVPTSVVVWLLQAEDRGLCFRVLADGRVHVHPRASITDADRVFLTAQRDLIRACITYIDEVAQWPV